MKKLNIGITFHPRENIHQTWFGSGIGQNIKFYYDLFTLLGHQCYMVVNTFDKGFEHNGTFYQSRPWQHILNGEVKLDVMLEAATNVGPHEADILKKAGTTIIGLRCANQLTILAEGLFLGGALHKGQVTTGQDCLWILPHHTDQASFLSIVHRANVETVPYIWQPDFIDKNGIDNTPRPAKPSVYVMEPNISTVKHCLIPLAILQKLYDDAPDTCDQMHILNSIELNKSEVFNNNVVQHLPVTHGSNNKLFFGARARFDEVFTRADILVSYQYHNELNYLHNEAFYKGISVVHNSPAYKELGYYYDQSNAIEGAVQLIKACQENSQINEQTVQKNRDFLNQFSIYNKHVQDKYQQLLKRAIDTSSRHRA